MNNHTSYDYEMHKLAKVRSDRLAASLDDIYSNPSGPYKTNPAMALFRDDIPSLGKLSSNPGRYIAELLGIEDKDAPLILHIRASYPACSVASQWSDYRYHDIGHALLTAIIVKRMSAIYLPVHPHTAKVAVLAALVHDSHHTQTPDDDANIGRAVRFTGRLMKALCSDTSDTPNTPFNSRDDYDLCASIIRHTKYLRGQFPSALPNIAPVPLTHPATDKEIAQMAIRLVCEADLMMSATPAWPELGAMLALEAADGGDDTYLDMPEFCFKQYMFARDMVDIERIRFPEYVAAAKVVIKIHKEIADQDDGFESPDADI